MSERVKSNGSEADRLAGRLLDFSLAGSLACMGIVGLGWSSAGSSSPLPVVCFLVLASVSMSLRHRFPLAMAILGSAALVLAVQLGSLNPAWSTLGAILVQAAAMLWASVTAYSLGATRTLWRGVPGLAALIVATQWQQPNPFPIVLEIGPWLLAQLLGSHRRMQAALRAQGIELLAERKHYTEEAVRYERTRIARELHDIVAHCMSMIVIQAAAGQHARDPQSPRRILDEISGLARQADDDLLGLNNLVANEDSQLPLTLTRLDELAEHARSAGSAVELCVNGDLDAISNAVARALWGVAQEGVTNAVRYAPGAPIAVTLTVGAAGSGATVVNGASRRGASPQPVTGGHNGLNGMRERVATLGGSLSAGPTEPGWRVEAHLPPDAAYTGISATRLAPAAPAEAPVAGHHGWRVRHSD